MIGFSATSSPPHEKFVNKCISMTKVLKFKSEYEMLHEKSPVSDPVVVTFKDRNVLIEILLVDLDKYFEKAPVIIILQDDMREKVINHLRVGKQKFKEGGS